MTERKWRTTWEQARDTGGLAPVDDLLAAAEAHEAEYRIGQARDTDQWNIVKTVNFGGCDMNERPGDWSVEEAEAEQERAAPEQARETSGLRQREHREDGAWWLCQPVSEQARETSGLREALTDEQWGHVVDVVASFGNILVADRLALALSQGAAHEEEEPISDQ